MLSLEETFSCSFLTSLSSQLIPMIELLISEVEMMDTSCFQDSIWLQILEMIGLHGGSSRSSEILFYLVRRFDSENIQILQHLVSVFQIYYPDCIG